MHDSFVELTALGYGDTHCLDRGLSKHVEETSVRYDGWMEARWTEEVAKGGGHSRRRRLLLCHACMTCQEDLLGHWV